MLQVAGEAAGFVLVSAGVDSQQAAVSAAAAAAEVHDTTGLASLCILNALLPEGGWHMGSAGSDGSSSAHQS